MSKRISRIIGPKGDAAIDMGAHLEKALGCHWKYYRKAFKRCRRKLSEKAVHKLRVETRRSLSLLDLIAPLVGRRRMDNACRRFKKVLSAFARLRDTQVQLVAFETEFRRLPESRAILKALRRREEKLIRKAGKKMKDTRLDELKVIWRSTNRRLKARFNREHSPLQEFQMVIRLVDNTYRAVMKLRQSINPTRPATIHHLRVTFKKFRYMVEALQEVMPALITNHAKEMQSFQTLMGNIQDTEVLLADLENLHSEKILSANALQTLRTNLLGKRSRQIAVFMGAKNQVARFWRSPSPRAEVKIKET